MIGQANGKSSSLHGDCSLAPLTPRLGGPFGATNIDMAFLDYLSTKVENFEDVIQFTGTGGHYVVRDKGRTLLHRFMRLKHDFQYGGNGGGDITVPRGIVIKDPAEGEEDAGVINLT